MIGSLSGF